MPIPKPISHTTQSNTVGAHSDYRPELDGIRAFAVLIVIANHFGWAAVPSGFLGVDVFFVLSGYVVCAAISRRVHLGFFAFLLDFYARRVRRILPALVLCVLVTAAVGVLFIQHPAGSLVAGAFALVGMSNLSFYWHSTDYFGEVARHNLFTHNWSLGVEEQFYLILPVVFLLTRTSWLRSRLSHASAMVVALGVLGAASFGPG